MPENKSGSTLLRTEDWVAETRFVELVSMEGGRPAAAFLMAQGINVVWTLILAYLLFGGVLFAVPMIK